MGHHVESFVQATVTPSLHESWRGLVHLQDFSVAEMFALEDFEHARNMMLSKKLKRVLLNIEKLRVKATRW